MTLTGQGNDIRTAAPAARRFRLRPASTVGSQVAAGPSPVQGLRSAATCGNAGLHTYLDGEQGVAWPAALGRPA
jgi:hypothetical protein